MGIFEVVVRLLLGHKAAKIRLEDRGEAVVRLLQHKADWG